MIDYELVELSPLSITWNKLKPIVERIRKQWNQPRIYEMFEYAYNEMQKRWERLQQIQQ